MLRRPSVRAGLAPALVAAALAGCGPEAWHDIASPVEATASAALASAPCP